MERNSLAGIAIKYIHREAMTIVEEAVGHERAGSEDEAISAYHRAAVKEEEAYRMGAVGANDRWYTEKTMPYVLLGTSAASLFFKAGEYEKAGDMVRTLRMEIVGRGMVVYPKLLEYLDDVTIQVADRLSNKA